jgi:hypothetical protein
MLKISLHKLNRIARLLPTAVLASFFPYLGMILSIETFAQTSAPNLSIDYIREETPDSFIVCKRPKYRDPQCTDDFEICNQFKSTYFLYQTYYSLEGLSKAISGDSYEKRTQELNQKTQELIQQARQGGVDINIGAFDALDDHAKGELPWLIGKQSMHLALEKYIQFYLMIKWHDPQKSYDSNSCKMETSNALKETSQCISNPNDFSKNDGCQKASVELDDYDFFKDPSSREVKVHLGEYLKTKNQQSLNFLMNNQEEFGFYINNNYINNLILFPKNKDISTYEIPQHNCGEDDLNLMSFVEKHLKEEIYPFMKTQIARMKCQISMKKINEDRNIITEFPQGQRPEYVLVRPAKYKINITACKHLCDTNYNFYSFVIPNYEQKNKLQQFFQIVVRNRQELDKKIAEMEAARNLISKERQAYLDSLKGQTTGADDGGNKEQIVMDCAKNPYLSGCVGRYTNDPRFSRNFTKKPHVIPTAESDDDGTGMVDADKGGGGIQPGSASGGSGGGSSPGGGGDSGGGGAPSVAGTGNLDDDKKKGDEEAPPLDLQGVSDYGGKKKKSSSGGGSGNYASGGNNKKSKNPFEDLFGDKKKGKDDRSGIHLRDIASSNAAEDEENGFSNLFSRITKTYQKKYHQGEVGDKKSSN